MELHTVVKLQKKIILWQSEKVFVTQCGTFEKFPNDELCFLCYRSSRGAR